MVIGENRKNELTRKAINVYQALAGESLGKVCLESMKGMLLVI
jgi:hypothetical protein